MKQKKSANIDEYISDFPKETRKIMEKIRTIIKKLVPEVEETISYAIPTFKLNGVYLIYFAGYKNHIGFYATPTGHKEFKEELSKYKQGKGSVQFPLNQPIPYDLIKRIVAFRVAAVKNLSGKNITQNLTAKKFIQRLAELKSDKELEKTEKYFKGNDGVTKSFGVKFGDLFKTAEDFIQMPLNEIKILLDSNFYEIRMGAVSIMDFQAKHKKTTDARKKELFDLYLKRHDRLNNWDFVDRGACSIIGAYLIDKPKDILYKLAKSKNPWERRTSIVSTYAFIKKGQVEETFKIAAILINDEHELINKAVGSWIREAGKKDQKKLTDFLDMYAPAMPRVTLRYAIEKLDKKQKEYYLNLKKK